MRKLAPLYILAMLFLLVSCDLLIHEHTFSSELSFDDTHHWYASTCEHTDLKFDIKEHSFSSELSSDDTHHWYASECDHEEVKTGIKEHSLGEWTKINDSTAGNRCLDCNHDIEMPFVEVIKSAGLPIVEINTEDGKTITSKEDWMDASMEISNASISSWNLDEIDIEIRGRGNSTWSQPKKPYAIKLSSKQEILGMPKHKRWVLLANYLDNSFMKNHVGFYISEKVGMEYTVRGEYVNLVLNGKYMGLYWLGEQIKVDKNRVDIVEEDDFLIEMDIYYDEAWKFKSGKNLPYMIKNDDDMTQERLNGLKDDIAKLENNLYVEDESKIEESIDIKSFAQFYVVNEIMSNQELKHPKSCYFTFDNESKILKAGPVWDFDWYTATSTKELLLTETLYYDRLFEYEPFSDAVEEILASDELSPEDLESEIERTEELIRPSVMLDRLIWSRHNNPYGPNFDSFDKYVDYLIECTVDRLSYMKEYDF